MSKSKRQPDSVSTRRRVKRAKRGWFYGKRPIFQFVGLFAVIMGACYAVTMIDAVEKKILPAYMQYYASASAMVMNVFGEGAEAKGTSVVSKRYSVNIKQGCDALAPSALFIAAVLAFPGSIRSKVPGLIVGTLVLAVINLVRIISLYYTGIHYPRWFETMHVDVWQPVFILLSLTLWVLWALWVMPRGPRPKTDAQTPV